MKRSYRRLLAGICLLALASCTLKIGSSTTLTEAPAPTALPLAGREAATAQTSVANPTGQPISLPAGFAISVFAHGLNGTRMLAVGPDGALYAAERGAGRIVRLLDADQDGQADGIEAVMDGLKDPSSLAFAPDGSLYVAETTRILRLSGFRDGEFTQSEVVIDGLPGGGHHTRTVLVSPDGQKLYVAVGSSCNVCEEADPRRAAILRYNLDGSGEELFARGLRNAVGLTFRPGAGEVWVSNNGRDGLGDDLPPETVYRVEQGQDYGWPRCHAGRVVDPKFGAAKLGAADACAGVPRAQVEIQAHSAPLGLAFYTGQQFPAEYRGDLFVALHGSWNRTSPVGYKVVRIPMDGAAPGPVEDFAAGWLVEGSAWGRPVDLVTGSDGSLYVSDDATGDVYRIYYQP